MMFVLISQSLSGVQAGLLGGHRFMGKALRFCKNKQHGRIRGSGFGGKFSSPLYSKKFIFSPPPGLLQEIVSEGKRLRKRDCHRSPQGQWGMAQPGLNEKGTAPTIEAK